MDQHSLIRYSQQLHGLEHRCADLFGSAVEALRRKHGVDTPESLEQALSALATENRLLNVGFVGRVKAGKSSLLNALFFDGRNILPKAATPMTAALTTLAYGDRFSAQVEFFSEQDLIVIRKLAGQYQEQLQALTERLRGDIRQRLERQAERTGRPVDLRQVQELAERQALVEMKRADSLAAAHEQVQLMSASGVDPMQLTQHAALDAASPEALAESLLEYVGAKGRYMPFTKIVHVFMPLEALRDIRVIDTPGTNDPVVSREERTLALLKTCDVVFFISPAGSFLDVQDVDLLDRITVKEGVQELVLVASRVDSQLFDSEKRARLEEAIENIRDKLTDSARRTLSNTRLSRPESRTVMDAMLRALDGGLLHSSGISLSLESQIAAPECWGSDERHAWNNLSEHYPDYFNHENQAFSRQSLARLGNIGALRAKLQGVRERKDQITAEKRVALIASKARALDAFRADLAGLARSQIEMVNSSDLGALQAQLRVLESRRTQLEDGLDFSYEQVMFEYRTSLRDNLRRESGKHLRESADRVAGAESSYTDYETRNKSGILPGLARFFGLGGTERVAVTCTSVMTSQVISALERFLFEVEQLLADTAQRTRFVLDRKLSQSLTPIALSVLEDDCKPELVARAVRGVVASLRAEPFSINISLPAALRAKGTLKGMAAEDYMSEARDFVSQLDHGVDRRIAAFIAGLESQTPPKISDVFLVELEDQARRLEDQVRNAAQTLDRLNGILVDIEGVAA